MKPYYKRTIAVLFFIFILLLLKKNNNNKALCFTACQLQLCLIYLMCKPGAYGLFKLQILNERSFKIHTLQIKKDIFYNLNIDILWMRYMLICKK